MSRSPFAILATVAGGCLLAASAFAANAGDAAVRVRYSELDLNKDAGVTRLYARLQHAADQACGSVDARDLAALTVHQACVKRALDRAVEDVHSARLTAVHQGARGQFARVD